MKHFITALFLLLCVTSYADIVTVPIPGSPGLSVTVGTGVNALPLQNIANTPGATRVPLGDDDNVQVPLGFNFPYFNQRFNTSWMHANGVVAFQSPSVTGNLCCSGVDLTTTTNPAYNYMIAAMWTDLININGSAWYKGNSSSMTYGWYNFSEYYVPSSQNSFEVTINSAGMVDTRISGAMVAFHPVTSGMTGNLSNGEYFQHYFGQGWNTNTPMQWGIGNTVADPCITDQLSSPTCPGYAVAYMTQQCTISPLYNPSCPGYAQAYFDQQCSINPLYSADCPGYAQAYHDQQCSADPLYATDCPGYAVAYFNQQCKINGLYDRLCPNYAEAYAKKMLLEQQSTTTVSVTSTIVDTSAAVSTEGTVTATPSTTGSATVDKAISTTTTTTNSAAAPAAPVQLVQQPKIEAALPQEKKTDSGSNATPQAAQKDSNEKPQPSARQQLAERRMEAAKKDAFEKGKNLANEMGKANDMESQKQIQNSVIQAMGFTPGFDAYGKTVIPEAAGYKPFTVYNSQVNVDNRRVGNGLFGSSDRLHNELVNSQYIGK